MRKRIPLNTASSWWLFSVLFPFFLINKEWLHECKMLYKGLHDIPTVAMGLSCK